MTSLDELFTEFQELRARRTNDWEARHQALRSEVVAAFRQSSRDAIAWVAAALADEQKKWFAAFAATAAGTLPRALFEPMLRAGVYEINPSLNRDFIEPCVDSRGLRATVERLLEYLEHGSDFEKAGAANALYWAQQPLSFPRGVREYTIEYAAPESRAAYEALADVWARKRTLLLREFVHNENFDVRRSIVPMLTLDESRYPDDLKPLVDEAIRIARSHPDEYIRHRIEIQLGSAGALQALPHRGRPA